MSTEITGKSVSLVELELDAWRGTQFEAIPLTGTTVPGWTKYWATTNVTLSGIEVSAFPSGRGIRVQKTFADNLQSFVGMNAMPDVGDVSSIALIRTHSATSPTGAGIILRGTVDASGSGYRCRFLNFASLELSKVVAGVATTVATLAFPYIVDEDLWLRFDTAAIAGGGVLLRTKAWRGLITDEPANYMLTYDDFSSPLASALTVHTGLSIPGVAVDFYCGFFRARSLFSSALKDTLRFAKPTSYLPIEFEAIPNVMDINQTPAILSLGENLGSRAQVSIKFKDHLHADRGEFFHNGTYWGRFRGRGLFRRTQPLRVFTGLLSQDIADYEIRHYYMDTFNGPTPTDEFTVLAQDILKFADNDRSQAPVLNSGFLVSAITNVATAATLSPANIGDEYATSGILQIGGKEVCTFIRSGDSLTLVRGQFGTTAIAHDAQDRVQECLYYNAQKASVIANDLFTVYAAMDPTLINLTNWTTEVDTYLQRLYTRLITEPTGVNRLVSELIQQAGLIIWWDNILETIQLQVLKGINTTAFEYNENNVKEGSIRVDEQRNKLITEVWVYYGIRNYLEPLDQPNNYRSSIAVPNLEAATLNGSPIIKKIFGTWMPTFARDSAQRAADLQLGRFAVPPRKVSFSIPRYSGIEQPIEAGGYKFVYHGGQNEFGDTATIPIQVTRVEPKEDVLLVEAEEMLFKQFSADDLSNRIILVDSNINDFNLRTVHDAIYPPVTAADLVASPPVTLTCIISAGVVVGASSTAVRAFDVGSWVAGFIPNIKVIGRLQGHGGLGGTGSPGGSNGATPGLVGSVALYTRNPINLDLSSGAAQIWGGGGGGGGGGKAPGGEAGGGGGGGGSGTEPGNGGLGGTGTSLTSDPGVVGTPLAGGAGGVGFAGAGNGGAGGGPGLVGVNGGNGGGVGAAGGAPGAAIDGLTFVNVLFGYGDIRGPQVN